MFRYGLIRVLHPALVPVLLLVALLVSAGAAGSGDGLPGSLDPAAAARVSLFGTLGALLLGACVWRAAAAGRDLTTRDRAWLLPRPTRPMGPLARFVLGLATAWTLAAAALGLGAYLGGEHTRALRLGPTLPGPDLIVLDTTSPTAAWQVDDPGGLLLDGGQGGVMSILVRALVGAGPSGELTLTLERDGVVAESKHRVAGTRRLITPLPAAGEGPLTIRLAHGGAPLAIATSEAHLHRPAWGSHMADLELALHLWLVGLAALVLGLGLGAFLRPVIAALAILSLGLVGLIGAHGHDVAATWSPVALTPWLEALGAAGEGWVPAHPPVAALASCLVAVALGLALVRGGLTRGTA